MCAYIEILGAVMKWRRGLTNSDLRQIGKFTRENVLAWMERQRSTDWVGTLPVEDFHAVCGDMDIPWATEEAKLFWTAELPFEL
jgi:hypothetical protein